MGELERRLDECAKNEVEIERLRAALEAVEWVRYLRISDADPGICPWCKGDLYHHHPDCQRQVALGKVVE
jgi:hypothetical protein